MGLVIGPLLERETRRALIGTTSDIGPGPMTCDVAIGTLVRVEYPERDSRGWSRRSGPCPTKAFSGPASDSLEPPRARL